LTDEFLAEQLRILQAGDEIREAAVRHAKPQGPKSMELVVGQGAGLAEYGLEAGGFLGGLLLGLLYFRRRENAAGQELVAQFVTGGKRL
jgi:hypothetical protein